MLCIHFNTSCIKLYMQYIYIYIYLYKNYKCLYIQEIIMYIHNIYNIYYNVYFIYKEHQQQIGVLYKNTKVKTTTCIGI